jgi:hypothetical protein
MLTSHALAIFDENGELVLRNNYISKLFALEVPADSLSQVGEAPKLAK